MNSINGSFQKSTETAVLQTCIIAILDLLSSAESLLVFLLPKASGVFLE